MMEAIYQSKSFQRAVKRYVKAPVHHFAAIVQPALAEVCRAELEQLGLNELAISDAGVEFSGKISECYRANLWLRTASRILLRFPSFRAGAVEDLYNRSGKIRWELWLNPRIPLQIEVHLHRSRIKHHGLAGNAVLTSIRERMMAKGLPPLVISLEKGDREMEEPRKQRIITRIVDNRCTISVDSSGPLLHRRGYRLRHTGAPLRETLAAAVLMKAGWRADKPLVDAMTGAGTIAIEAAMIAKNIAPGMNRTFLFQYWPSFLSSVWEYICRTSREKTLPHSPVPILAIDKDEASVKLARGNAEQANVASDIKWWVGDFVEFRPASMNLPPGLVIINPPYGRRMKEENDSLYSLLGKHLRAHFKGWQVAVLIPDRKLIPALREKKVRVWTVNHGGLDVDIVLFQIPKE